MLIPGKRFFFQLLYKSFNKLIEQNKRHFAINRIHDVYRTIFSILRFHFEDIKVTLNKNKDLENFEQLK